MWIFPWTKFSWHSGSMWNKFGWLSWFCQFICDGLSSFDPKGFYYSYAWSCSLCEVRTSFCMGLISRKLHGFFCFWLALLHSMSYAFFLYWICSSSLCTVLYSISSNIDEVLAINPFVIMFFFGVFNILLVSFFGEFKFFYNCSVSNDFTHMFNFLTWIPDWLLESCSFRFISIFWL